MKIGVPCETFPGEKRVALTPKICGRLIKGGDEVWIESGAGELSGFTDQSYSEAGAQIAPKRRDVFANCDVIAQVRSLGANPMRGAEDVQLLRPGQIVIGLCDPLSSPFVAETYAYAGVTSFSLELLPRITKAQSMDVLSSQATLVGYYSAVLAASSLCKIFPMLMTAAGTTKAAKVLVLGAGVAGLQAIATARRLGAVVQGYDVRPAAIEQIQSLGAKVVPLDLNASQVSERGGYAGAVDDEVQSNQRRHLTPFVSDSDVVICTAAVPGRRAPVLISEEMVRTMQPGGVIVDLAAETGGNCELTQTGEIIERHGVTIIGSQNLASRIAYHASEMFAQNVQQFFTYLKSHFIEKDISNDEIVTGTLITRDYQVVHPRIREIYGFGEYCIIQPSQSNNSVANF